MEFGIWPRRATDEAHVAVNASLVAASNAVRAVADIDLVALDAAYALLRPTESSDERAPNRLERSGGEDGEEKGEEKGGNGEGDVPALSSPAAVAAFPTLANPLGLFGGDHAAAVGDGNVPPLVASGAAVSPTAAAAAAAPTPAPALAPAPLGEAPRLRILPVLQQSASASLQAPPPASPLSYAWARSPQTTQTNLAFSAADACAPADAALAKVGIIDWFIMGAYRYAASPVLATWQSAQARRSLTHDAS